MGSDRDKAPFEELTSEEELRIIADDVLHNLPFKSNLPALVRTAQRYYKLAPTVRAGWELGVRQGILEFAVGLMARGIPFTKDQVASLADNIVELLRKRGEAP